MIKTLTGSNNYLLRAELDSLVEKFVQEYGDMAYETVDADEADYQRLLEAIQNLPFLADKKLIVLRNPGSNKQFAENFADIVDSLPDNNDVVIYEPKLDKRTAYAKLLKKLTDYQLFDEVDTRQLPKWLQERAAELGGSIKPADASYLVSRIGANQQMLDKELEKLVVYDSQVSRQSIDQLTEPTPQSTIFQLLETAFAGDLPKTLQTYQDQRTQRVEPQAILPMIAWQLQILAIVKAAGQRPPDEISKQAGLNPFVVRKSQSLARQLSQARIKQLISSLRQLDVKLKTASVDADEAVLSYLVDLAGE